VLPEVTAHAGQVGGVSGCGEDEDDEAMEGGAVDTMVVG